MTQPTALGTRIPRENDFALPDERTVLSRAAGILGANAPQHAFFHFGWLGVATSDI